MTDHPPPTPRDHAPPPPAGDATPRGTLFVVGVLVLTILGMWFLVYGVLAGRG